jgi:BirA family biotin operon repressor/biotin-[acetyl-CoA-carboxylase] ligase
MRDRRKLAGILAEATSLGTPEQAIVVGIGINILRSSHPPAIALRATSIEEQLDATVDREALLESVLVGLITRYNELCAGETDGILRAWRAAAPSAHGARVEFADGSTRGITAGIDDEGALLVDTGAGIERVISGELRWP